MLLCATRHTCKQIKLGSLAWWSVIDGCQGRPCYESLSMNGAKIGSGGNKKSSLFTTLGLFCLLLLLHLSRLDAGCVTNPCPPKRTVNPDDDNPLVVVRTVTKTIVTIVNSVNSLTVIAPDTTSTSTIYITSTYTSTELKLSTISTTTTIQLPVTVKSTFTKAFIDEEIRYVETFVTSTLGTVTQTSLRTLSYVFTSYSLTTLFRSATDVSRITSYTTLSFSFGSVIRVVDYVDVVKTIVVLTTQTTTDNDFVTTESSFQSILTTEYFSADTTTMTTTTIYETTFYYNTYSQFFYQPKIFTSSYLISFDFIPVMAGTFSIQTGTATILIN